MTNRFEEMDKEDAAAQGAEPQGRRLRVTWASEIEPEPVIWAWKVDGHGRIPAGSLSVAAGREGTGKSSFGLWMAANITRGTLPGSFYGKPRSVLYIAIEDSWKHTLVPRLMAAGADLAKVARLDVVTDADDDVTLSLPADLRLLEREIDRHGVALVVIDPLMSVMGEGIDTHRNREVRTALDPLAKLASRTGALLLGIAHFNKGAGTDAASLISGSGAFKDVPRAVFGFARDEETSERVMTQVKNSLGSCDLPSLSYEIQPVLVPTKKGDAETSRLDFVGESVRSVSDILGDRGDDDRSERDDAIEWLRSYLTAQGGEASREDLMKAARAERFSESTIKRARRKAGVETSPRQGFGGGTVWRLNPQSDQSGHSQSSQFKEQNPDPTDPTVTRLASERHCVACGFPLHPGLGDVDTHPNCYPEGGAA